MKPPPLKQTSWAERGTILVALVAMHMRSEAASAPANAQQQPQLDWSRMSPMILAHCGQCSAESKLSGMALFVAVNSCFTISPFLMPSSMLFAGSTVTPHIVLEAPGAWSAKRG